MANNRMYLRNKITKDVFLLAKYSGDVWWTRQDSDKLDEWFKEQQIKTSEQRSFDWMWGPTCFDIEFETDEELRS